MDVREKTASEKRLIDYYYLAEKIECPGVRLVYWDDVEAAPTVDAVEVVHGRWIEQEKYTFGTMYDCSICGTRILDNGHPWNYCPNCGAKMDGGDGNSDIA